MGHDAQGLVTVSVLPKPGGFPGEADPLPGRQRTEAGRPDAGAVPGATGAVVSARLAGRIGPCRPVLNGFGGPRDGPGATRSPLPADNPQVGGFFAGAYFFLPWFFTASMAAFAASGSRYVPPGFSGLKSASSS